MHICFFVCGNNRPSDQIDYVVDTILKENFRQKVQPSILISSREILVFSMPFYTDKTHFKII